MLICRHILSSIDNRADDHGLNPYFSKHKVSACTPHSIPFRRHAETTVYSGALQHIRNVESMHYRGSRIEWQMQSSPESAGCTPEWTTDFGWYQRRAKWDNRSNLVRYFPQGTWKGIRAGSLCRRSLCRICPRRGLSPRHDPPVILCLPVDRIPAGHIIGYGRRPEDKWYAGSHGGLEEGSDAIRGWPYRLPLEERQKKSRTQCGST